MVNVNLYFVRHGQRIDQVDTNWSTSSPCPQDPPLTDQGRSQARQTGKMIYDFALERMSGQSIPSKGFSPKSQSTATAAATAAMAAGIAAHGRPVDKATSLQRITPPDSPDLNGFQVNHSPSLTHTLTTGATAILQTDQPTTATKRQNHFALVTSPFLRCAQTAVEMAIGIRAAIEANQQPGCVNNVTTIAVESALAEWLSLEYVAEPVPESIIVQRMQEFAQARREHEKYYSVDWKYQARRHNLPGWPEAREDMQTRLEQALKHILDSYTSRMSATNDMETDLSIVFVTHASPVNALLEACLQTPILVPVPNCSISRCRWIPLSKTKNDDDSTAEQEQTHMLPLVPDVFVRSKHSQTLCQEQGHWLLDYQTYTRHLDRDLR
ncbi:hypothetical protein BGZ94_000968 [Podila epigama]|nr:hypothetical protein BGZ94_000968 [Podila epigama]